MKATLLSLHIEHFKGIVNKTIEFTDKTSILGKNGSGKTSAMDAFLWLINGIDSTGRVSHGKGGFDIRPHDQHKKPVPGVTVVVEARIDLDGQECTLRKENVENRTKGHLEGFETACYIDDVPKLLKDYKEFTGSICEEKKFRMLADIHYFNSDKMKWGDRRKILLEIAGETSNPTGFDDMFDAMGNRTIDDYEKLLKTENTGYAKEAKGIPPRIDENTNSLTDQGELDVQGLEKQRDAVIKVIDDLKTDRNVIVMKEGDRQKFLTNKNVLESQKNKRESELANDTSNIQKYANEKSGIIVKVNESNAKCSGIRNEISIKQAQIKSAEAVYESSRSVWSMTLADYNNCLNTETESACSKCGQELPEDKLIEYEASKDEVLNGLQSKGTAQKDEWILKHKIIETRRQELKDLLTQLDHAEIELEEAETAKDGRFEHLDACIAADVKVKPADDSAWIKLDAQIVEVELKIGEPVTDQLAAIDSQITIVNASLDTLKDALRNHDNNEKANKRIKELSARETELGVLITQVDGKLEQIKQYKLCQNGLIEESVNKLFDHVSFKLFGYQINGDVEFCCTAHYDGSADYSYGESMVVGAEIHNVLCKHYDADVPMFIDNAGELTLTIETDSQVIRLVADVDVDELEVK